MITEGVAETEEEPHVDGERDGGWDALRTPDTVTAADAVRTLAVAVTEEHPELVTEPERTPEEDEEADRERGAEGDTEEEGHIEVDTEGVVVREPTLLAVVCAEPVKLTLALGETVEARETEGCPLVLRAAEEEASELFEGAGDPLTEKERALVRVKLVTSVEDTVGESVKSPERLEDCDKVEEAEAERLTDEELLGVE